MASFDALLAIALGMKPADGAIKLEPAVIVGGDRGTRRIECLDAFLHSAGTACPLARHARVPSLLCVRSALRALCMLP